MATPEAHQLFYSHGTIASTGVGVLVAKSFLQNFDPTGSSRLEEIVPGRVGRLRLQGPLGNIDMICVYLTTGNARKAHCSS